MDGIELSLVVESLTGIILIFSGIIISFLTLRMVKKKISRIRSGYNPLCLAILLISMGIYILKT